MPDAHVGERETLVQRYLADAGFNTPVVRLAGGPGAQLDKAWMIMDFADGKPMLDGLSGPSALIRLPHIARNMPDHLAAHAARLHEIDSIGLLRKLGVDDDVGELLDKLGNQVQALDHADLTIMAEWLGRHRPTRGRTVICHGDLHPFNVLRSPSGDTIIDWSASRIAAPEYDLAFTNLLLSHPPLAAPSLLRPVIGRAGKALGRRFLASYAKEARTAVDSDRLDWFTMLHSLRMLTELATWEAQDELGDHPGHPFITLRPHLNARVASILLDA